MVNFTIFDYFFIYYRLFMLVLVLIVILIPKNSLNITIKQDLLAYFILICLLIMYLYIKSFLIVITLLSVFTWIKFLYSILFKEKTTWLEYVRITSFKTFLINILAFKYNCLFLSCYNRVKHVSNKNNIFLICSNLILLSFFFFLGIPSMYIKILVRLSEIIETSIKTYFFSLRSHKTVFVILFLIFEKIIKTLNFHFSEENEVSKNKIIYKFLKRKNGFFLDTANLLAKMLTKNPAIIKEFHELKCFFTEENFQKKSMELKFDVTRIHAGKKNNANTFHNASKIKNNEEHIEEKYTLCEVYSSKNKEKILNNTEIIKGQDFNTKAMIAIVRNDCIQHDQQEFSKQFKLNNFIFSKKDEFNFLNQRILKVKKKIFDKELPVKIIEKEDEYTNLLFDEHSKLTIDTKAKILEVSTPFFKIIGMLYGEEKFNQLDFEQQKLIVNIYKADIFRTIELSSKEDIVHLFYNILGEEKFNEIKKHANEDTQNLVSLIQKQNNPNDID